MEINPLYYNPRDALSYNFYWLFCNSMRGGGKTFGWLSHIINYCLKNGREFVYVRRTVEDLKEALTGNKLFEDMINFNLFPDITFSIKKNIFYANETVLGYGIPLATAKRKKGSPYPKVDYILYDEYILEDDENVYVRGEVRKFLSLIETVGRTRDNMRIICLGNKITKTNPYYEYFNIHPQPNSIFSRYNNGLILVQNYSNTEFKEFKAKTKFAKLIKETEYGNFMLNNEPIEDNYTFVEKLTTNSPCACVLKINKLKIGMYLDTKTGYLYLKETDTEIKGKTYAFDLADNTINTVLYKSVKPRYEFKELLFCIENSLCRYESLQVKNAVLELTGYKK